MILFELRCSRGHAFDAWFRDGVTYDRQAARGEISCSICGDERVSKALMAPAVGRRARATPKDHPAEPAGAPERDPERAAAAMRALRQVQDHIEKTFDHVGPRFAEEARKIHYGETDKRSIYGEATKTEAKELRDEGIEVGQIPWLPRHDG